MRPLLNSLFALQALEVNHGKGSEKDVVRKNIPQNVLDHYDRLRQRGKKGIAWVRNGVCGQCHMRVAHGLLADLRRADQLYRCENCGTYLSLAEETAPVMEMPLRSVKPGRGRPRKKLSANVV
jgi:predicted  nucleic acid-binding Zn-ribbon protein